MADVDVPNEEDPADESKDDTFEQVVLDVARLNVKLFCDRTGKPCVRLPDDPRTWPLRSDRFKAWFSYEVELQTKEVLKRSDLHNMLRILEGQAFATGVLDSDDNLLWQSLEDEPALLVTYEFMQDKLRVEYPTEILRGILTKLAQERHIDIQAKKWPAIARLLSVKLNRYKDLLQQAGITVSVEHRRDGSWTILERQNGDDGDAEPSPASQPNTPQMVAAQQRDAGEARDDKNQDTKRQIREMYGNTPTNVNSQGVKDE